MLYPASHDGHKPPEFVYHRSTAIAGPAAKWASRTLDSILLELEREPISPTRQAWLHIRKDALERLFVPRWNEVRP